MQVNTLLRENVQEYRDCYASPGVFSRLKQLLQYYRVRFKTTFKFL